MVADKEHPFINEGLESGNLSDIDLSLEDRHQLDDALHALLETSGDTVYLPFDFGDAISSDVLLGQMVEWRLESPERFQSLLQDAIDLGEQSHIEQTVDEIIAMTDVEDLEAAQDYLMGTYLFRPAYEDYMEQNVLTNLLITHSNSTVAEVEPAADRSENALCPFASEREDFSDGLTWLVNQQGHSMKEVWEAAKDADHLTKEELTSRYGPFVPSVANEIHHTQDRLNVVTALADLSFYELIDVLDPKRDVVMPPNTMVGLFNPWTGRASTFGIQLERNLVIPPDKRFDVQIEGGTKEVQTVRQLLHLPNWAWKSPASFEWHQEQENPFPSHDAKKEQPQKPPRYAYRSIVGNDEQVELSVSAYTSNGNLFVGLRSFNEEWQGMEPYADVTVNIGRLPYLHACIDTNNLTPDILAFLTENGLGEPIGQTLLSGYCEYPVFRFNEEPLREANPVSFAHYQQLHEEKGKEILQQAFMEEPEQPLEGLIKEAKEKAAEKNSQHPEPPKSTPPPALG